MTVDARTFELLKQGKIPPGLQIGQVAPHLSLPDGVIDEMMARAADEETYKRTLNDRQWELVKAQRALETIVNLQQVNLFKADGFPTSTQGDLELARDVRREALKVLKSFLESESK